MATEQTPEYPDLRALRRAYAEAIASTRRAGAAHIAALAGEGTLREIAVAYLAAWARETEAGRAYMDALAQADPDCTHERGDL